MLPQADKISNQPTSAVLDDKFFADAQEVIEKVLRARTADVMDQHGRVQPIYKEDNSPVTELDKSLEQELRQALNELDSSIGIWGEEYGQEGNQDTFWLVDPIDGTANFVRGIPNVRSMVTLIDNGQPVFALVYRFPTDELYVAIKGRGTYKNGVRQILPERSMNKLFLELSLPPVSNEASAIWQDVYAKIAQYRVGDFLMAVEGKIDGLLAYKAGGGPWDYAPRVLLLQEAGAKVTNIGSDTYHYSDQSFLAVHPSNFDELMAVIDGALERA